jgi:hypothetical protein
VTTELTDAEMAIVAGEFPGDRLFVQDCATRALRRVLPLVEARLREQWDAEHVAEVARLREQIATEIEAEVIEDEHAYNDGIRDAARVARGQW